MPSDPHTIGGHPAVAAIPNSGRAFNLTVCAECGRMRTVLFLSRDRWYCTACRNSGDARPTTIPMSLGGRRHG